MPTTLRYVCATAPYSERGHGSRGTAARRKERFSRCRLIECVSVASSGGHDGDARNGTLFRLICTSGDAAAQTAPAPENWTPIGRTTQTITGRVTFTPAEITFQNGKSLPLAHGGQMLFRPEAKKRKVMADLYKVTSPDDPVLENGNKLCKGKPVAYLIVWKSGEGRQRGRSAYFGTFLRAEAQRRLARRLRALHLRRGSALK